MESAEIDNNIRIRMECQDGLLSLLPGDFMYPSDPDYIGLDGTDPNRFVVYESKIRIS